MAGRGFAPKDPSARPRPKTKDALDPIKVRADGVHRGFALDNELLPEGEIWHRATQRWWANWRASAQATSWVEADWDFLVDTALLHHRMWTDGAPALAAEIRLRVAKFGATPEDRMRLRMTIEADQAEVAATGAGVTNIQSRRKKLTS